MQSGFDSIIYLKKDSIFEMMIKGHYKNNIIMKLNLKILGAGCSKCETLEKVTAKVVRENHFNADMEKVEDIAEIMKYHILSAPALVINEKVVSSGRVPTELEIKFYIEEAISEL